MCFVNEIANTKEARLLELTRFILFKTMNAAPYTCTIAMSLEHYFYYFLQ